MPKLNKKKLREEWDALSEENRSDFLDTLGLVVADEDNGDTAATVRQLQKEIEELKKGKTITKKGFFESFFE